MDSQSRLREPVLAKADQTRCSGFSDRHLQLELLVDICKQQVGVMVGVDDLDDARLVVAIAHAYKDSLVLLEENLVAFAVLMIEECEGRVALVRDLPLATDVAAAVDEEEGTGLDYRGLLRLVSGGRMPEGEESSGGSQEKDHLSTGVPALVATLQE
jgi:hypothetical protein